ncbi:MAG: hypothetical protein IH841_05010, partial [Thaumarchaeota archaeon]|nr:hypothetical protein [Nitrososphaerota archaeon]
MNGHGNTIMKISLFLALIPIILSIGIIPVIPFTNAEVELQCMSGEVTVVRTTNPDPICINEITANRWVQLGIAEIIGEPMEEEMMEETMVEEKMEVTVEEKIAVGVEVMKDAMAMKLHEWITATGTIDSMQDQGMGHESHQLAIILPPTDKIYKGILSYSASEPIQLIALHGPLAEGEDKGQPIWAPDDKTKFALTFVDKETSTGSWLFTGNALAVHTKNTEQFTVSYSVSYLEKEMSDTVSTATMESVQDPGIGHEAHSIVIILPPSEMTYSGMLTYSASEPIQLIALHGPLAEGE